mmetsp:Transcript_13718/g.25721  ORF Transcript_13718/g.25721 Transcript_13718/m.25721 type:complete len:189 (+) Transcript_13718:3-569(+)
MICGGSYPDHLELWWSKHLYSPYDQYLDKTYTEAMTISEEKQPKTGSRSNSYHQKTGGTNRSKQRTSSSSTSPQVVGTPSFGFHKRYVRDVSDIVQGVKDPREQVKLIKKKFSPTLLKSNHYYRMARVPSAGVTYIAPGATKGKSYSRRDAFADLLSVLILGSIDDMVYVQGIENKKLKSPKPIHDRL